MPQRSWQYPERMRTTLLCLKERFRGGFWKLYVKKASGASFIIRSYMPKIAFHSLYRMKSRLETVKFREILQGNDPLATFSSSCIGKVTTQKANNFLFNGNQSQAGVKKPKILIITIGSLQYSIPIYWSFVYLHASEDMVHWAVNWWSDKKVSSFIGFLRLYYWI